MPRDVEKLIREKFPRMEAELIIRSWSLYAQMRFSEATTREILKTARMVLTLASETKPEPEPKPEVIDLGKVKLWQPTEVVNYAHEGWNYIRGERKMFRVEDGMEVETKRLPTHVRNSLMRLFD